MPPLTTASRFEYVRVSYNYSSELPSSISGLVDGNTRSSVASMASGLTNLASVVADSGIDIFQTIYASDDGFLDPDGNAITIEVARGPGGITSLADVEKRGLINPFDNGSYDRWVQKNRILGIAQLRGSVSEDSDTGLETIDLAASIRSTRKVALGSSLFSLAGFSARVVSDTLFDIYYEFDDDDGVALANVGDQEVMSIFEAWLNDRNVTLPDVEFSSQLVAADFAGITFRFAHGDDFSVDAVLENLYYNPNFDASLVRRWFFRWQKTSGSDLIETELDAMVAAATVTIDSGDGEMTHPAPIIAEGAEVRAKFLQFPDEKKIISEGEGLSLVTRDPAGHIVHMPFIGSFSLKLDYEDLDDEVGATDTKLMPRQELVDTIHYKLDSLSYLKFRPPPDHILSNGVSRPFRVHNTSPLGGSGRLSISAHNGDGLTDLMPGEEAQFRVLHDHGGGGEVVIVSAPSMFDIRAGANQGNLSSYGRFLTTAGDQLILMPPGGASRNDEAGLEAGASNYTENATLIDNAGTAFWNSRGLKVHFDGQLFWQVQYLLEIHTSPFNFAGGHSIELWRKRPGSSPSRIANKVHGYFDYAQGIEQYDLNEAFPVRANDEFLCMLRRKSTNLSPSLGNISVQSSRRTVILSSIHARVEYTP